jgi:hypothetical protein
MRPRALERGGVLLICLPLVCGGTQGADPRPNAMVTGGAGATVAVAPTSRDSEPPASAADTTIEFVRVNAAPATIRDVPLDEGRYVPMTVAEFDAAVAQAEDGRRRVRRPIASAAEYDLASDGQGTYSGTLVFQLDGTSDGLPFPLPIGAVATESCILRTAAGGGEVAVFGLPDGGVAVQTAGPGTYACSIRLPRSESAAILRIPLVPALVTTLRLALPAGVRPIVLDGVADGCLVEAPSATEDAWRIVVAAMPELRIAVWDTRRTPPPVACWNRVSIRGRQADVATRIIPAAGWTPACLDLQVEPGLLVTGVRSDDDREVSWTLRDQGLNLLIPDRLVGSRIGLVVTAMAPIAESSMQRVPGLRPAASRWAGCGTELITDPAFAVEGITLEQCLAVASADAARWPLPTGSGAARLLTGGMLAVGGRVFLEHQTPAAGAWIEVGPRSPALDTARVTTVDISPGTVLGRAACDVRVVAGEVFAVTAAIAPGWFIDSVEVVDWRRGGSLPRDGQATGSPGLDWRVVLTPEGSELRIGLAVAATPARGLGLRITGHRPGVPLGGRFSAAELDMVRLPGEAPESALLEFRVGPMAVVEAEVGALAVEPATDRLALLASEAAPRARVRAGERAPALTMRLVRRRPPVDAEVRVGLVARDERLAENFSFVCRPVAGEIDAIVVHFSEPMASGLEWSLIEPASGSLAARRLDPGEAARGASFPEGGVAESWLVDVRPATASMVRITASRTVLLESALPVPLAWVEAAERPGGIVTISGEGGQRPEVLNRRLRELPPLAAAGDPATVELAYGSPGSGAAGGAAAAELQPAEAASGSRAWAWRETITCRCHDSGMLEWETVLDIENQGRGSVNLTVPEGLRLEQVTVAGVTIAAQDLGPSGGTLGIPLPAGRGRISLVVQGTGRRDGRLGWWSVGSIACGVDLPILDREARLLLPPGLELAAGRTGWPGPASDWAARLFNASLRSASGTRQGEAAGGSFDVTSTTRGGMTTAVIVRRRLLDSLAILAGGIAAAAAWVAVRRYGSGAVIGCGVAGITALWCDPPWDTVARAVWWGGIAGTWAAIGWRSTAGVKSRIATLTVVVGLTPWATGAAAEETTADPQPLRVIVSPGANGGTALVPERLFRRLAIAEAAAGSPSLRVVTADVIVDPDGGAWQVSLDVDADRGGTLQLAAPEGGGWQPAEDGLAGALSVTGDAQGGGVRLFAAEGGRHRIRLRFQPRFSRDCGIEAAVMPLPPAAVASLLFAPAADDGRAAGWRCDRSIAGGPWLPATRLAGGTGLDISQASQVRLVRPIDADALLMPQPRTAESFNDISWRASECRVDATFKIGGDTEIVRRIVVRTDPWLEPIPGSVVMLPLGDGRFLIELPQPSAGPRTVAVAFQMPLVDPVGLFEVPGVWIEGVGNDVRTVRLRPDPGFEASPELPLGTALMRPRPEDGPATTAVWRSDATASGTDAPRTAEELMARPRIAVRRRSVPVRGSQSLVVDVSGERIALQLDVELEATALPLVELPIEVPAGVTIDRVTMTRRAAEGGATAGKNAGMADCDIVWSRIGKDRLAAVVQRPETGLFHLRLDGRIPGPTPAQGRLPVLRAAAAGILPITVTWQVAPGLALSLSEQTDPLGGERAGDFLEIPPGEPGPLYTLSRDLPLGLDDGPAADPVHAVAVDVGVALTEVDLAIDHRGRGWGLARFDLVAPEPLLLLELPMGLRLFDVRVDGREVTAVPRTESTWEVRLHDVTWPRTLVVVFAGTVGGRLADGKAIHLEPPRIVGLPGATVLWSLDPPPGFLMRVSAPARRLDAKEWTASGRRGREWYEEAFQAAIATASESEREWLEEFAASRRDGLAPAGEQAWYEAWNRSVGNAPSPTFLDAGTDGGVTIRAVPIADVTAGGRGLTTLLLAGVALAIWTGSRRFPAIRASGTPVARWWWLACGSVWLLVLTPSLPGWLMLVVGAWLALVRPGVAGRAA